MITEDALAEALQTRLHVEPEKIRRLLEMHHKKGKKLSELLISEGLVSDHDYKLILSEVLRIPILNLSTLHIDPEVVQLIPRKLAEQYKVIAISKMGQTLTIAVSDPLDLPAMDDIRQRTGCVLRPILATSEDIERSLETYFAESAMLEEAIEEIDESEFEIVEDTSRIEPTEARLEEAPAIRLVDTVIQEAIRRRASDIHFETYDNEFRVRYRIDGQLVEVFKPPNGIHPSVMARIKIISLLDITEKRLPQDGRFKLEMDGREIDFRVSILPTQFGEKAVLRILERSNVMLNLEQLGFLPEPLEKFKEAIRKPYGMILVTGPTGSGKSTTLYSVLNSLNTPDRNIMTVEDPIEYQIDGISQTQVNADIGLTFASGLRSILRQSPDVILVGEIRDFETADIAVKAALTGHLVLSTLHTNNASGAVTRLIDMGVEPFLIASSLIMVSAQRLCRKICGQCKEKTVIPEEVLRRLKVKQEEAKAVGAYRGKGCEACMSSGYLGRIGTMEALTIDEEIRNLILNRSTSDSIETVARRKGMHTLFENTFQLFKTGLTTLEEVLNITMESENA